MAERDKILRDQLMQTNGTSPYETLSLILPSLCYTTITSTFCIEFLTLIMPTILNVTVLADYSSEILTTSFIICLSLLLLVQGGTTTKKVPKTLFENVTNSRSTVNVISVVAILAVDFLTFPRRLVKTETFGHSLMDVGVGLYMVSNGIVEGGNHNLLKSLKGCTPLLVLGVVRFFVTTQIDYHVPVSEYGVHWNFFLTLAVTKLFVTLLFSVVSMKFIWINACLLMISHEVLLECGLKNLVFSNAKRTNFFLANKEGIVSSIGYVCIYLFGAYFSHVLELKKGSSTKKMIPKFVVLCALSFFVSTVCERYFGISRKLANTAYCFWVLFVGMLMVAGYSVCSVILHYVFKDKLFGHPPLIHKAINYNALVFFLLSNLLTGLVNILCDTLKVSSIFSIVIISVYMFINCAVVCILYQKQIKLKL